MDIHAGGILFDPSNKEVIDKKLIPLEIGEIVQIKSGWFKLIKVFGKHEVTFRILSKQQALQELYDNSEFIIDE